MTKIKKLSPETMNHSYMGLKTIKVKKQEYTISAHRDSNGIIHCSYHQLFTGSYECFVAPGVSYDDLIRIIKDAIRNKTCNVYYGFDGMIKYHDNLYF